MKRSAHASVSPLHPLSLACLTLVAAGAFSCSGEGGGEAGAAEATVEIEWHNPELKRAKKSEGTTLYGQFVGPRTWWWPTGEVQKKGQYDDQGREAGEWQEYFTTGFVTAKYQYEEGVLEGPYLGWHPNGNERVKGRYEAGKKSGEWLSWHENGELMEKGTYRAGAKVGVHEGFSFSGKLVARGEYSDSGEGVSLAMWYEDGSDAHVVPFVAGKRHGTERFWWDNGQTRYEKVWENGAQIGEGRHWHADGSRHLLTSWDSGRLSGVVREWHPNGQLGMMVAYEGGARTGILRQWFPDGQPKSVGAVDGELSEGLQQFWWPSGKRKLFGVAKNGLREGPWAFWDEAGVLQSDLSGIYAADQRTGALDDAGIAMATQLSSDTSPQPLGADAEALIDPADQYDEKGEPLGG